MPQRDALKVTLPQELLRQLEQTCRHRGVTKSAYVERLIVADLAASTASFTDSSYAADEIESIPLDPEPGDKEYDPLYHCTMAIPAGFAGDPQTPCPSCGYSAGEHRVRDMEIRHNDLPRGSDNSDD